MLPFRDYENTLSLQNVPRGTFCQIRHYLKILETWNQRINLVSRKSIPLLWERHALDSLQLYPLLKPGATVADMGSGAGFPGMILSLMGIQQVTLIESDQRKCIFLQEVARQTGALANIANERIEKLDHPPFDILVSRGLASISQILTLSRSLRRHDSVYLLLKGEGWKIDLEEAAKMWHFHVDLYPSSTHPKGKVIVLSEVVDRL